MPDSLGRYRLKRELGHGAMGVVYEGWDSDLNRPVAIKTIRPGEHLHPELAAEYSRRFVLEARNAGQLMHPNIVTVFDFGHEATMDFLVMELIHGKELKAYLDAGHVFSIAESVDIACQLLEALDYVHSKHIFHRDIKPANVMLEGETRRVRLTDFGVARFSAGHGRDGTHSGTHAGTLVGTPGFMPPEQIHGEAAGAAADLFATGALLYQCLTLQRPFFGTSALEIWHKTVNEDPPPMSGYRGQIPPALERAVRHALAKKPLERPASARALIEELQDAIAGKTFDEDETRLVMAREPKMQPAPVSHGKPAVSLAKRLPIILAMGLVLIVPLAHRASQVFAASPVPATSPANVERKSVRVADGARLSRAISRPRADIEKPATTKPIMTRRVNHAQPGPAAAEVKPSDADGGFMARDQGDDTGAEQKEQARYLRLAQLAESRGDSHEALALYKHAYDAGSGGDATPSMRKISFHAAQAMSTIFGRADERIQQLTWHMNAKTMEINPPTSPSPHEEMP